MFKDKFITCIKVNNEIIREEKNTVFLPYGTKFSLFYKNLSSDNILVNSIATNDFQEIPRMISVDTMNDCDDPIGIIFTEDLELLVKWSKLNKEDTVYNSMTFLIKGINTEEQITNVITTKTKKICSSCGKKFKGNYNYCPFDGTYLIKDM